MYKDNTMVSAGVWLYFFIRPTAQIAQVAQPIWIALLGQLRQSEEQLKYSLWFKIIHVLDKPVHNAVLISLAASEKLEVHKDAKSWTGAHPSADPCFTDGQPAQYGGTYSLGLYTGQCSEGR